MKRGLKYVRCPAEDFRRLPVAESNWPGGFSLIELLVVAAILLLLFTLYWGPSASGNRQRQAQKDCQTRLQKIHLAMAIYANDHGGKFPELAGARTSEAALDALVPRYTVDTAVFVCPATSDSPPPQGESIRKRRISYAYYMGRRAEDSQQVLMSDAQVDTRPKAAGEDAFSRTGKPPGNNHGQMGGNFLFCDGRAESAPPRLPFSLLLTQGVVLLNPGAK
ncbi:MAG: prepilin-type N-terminal cleavage/methylation domain-containing protein [Verrucomicrobiota bacterium]|jgi:prepilin-type N-terminal cleavage/methylation domain-containing protein/prepilin-type processing-associated H-X9-DG protein